MNVQPPTNVPLHQQYLPAAFKMPYCKIHYHHPTQNSNEKGHTC